MPNWPVVERRRSARAVFTTTNPEFSVPGEAGVVIRTFANGSGAWPSANRAIAMQCLLEETITVTQMAVFNGATVAGNFSLGIYSENFVQLVVSANTAQSGASVPQYVDITDTTLGPGVYFVAMSTDSATATYNRAVTNGTMSRQFGLLNQDTAYPLPNPFVPAATNPSSYVPMVFLNTYGAF